MSSANLAGGAIFHLPMAMREAAGAERVSHVFTYNISSAPSLFSTRRNERELGRQACSLYLARMARP